MKTFFVTNTQIDPKSWSMIGVSSKPNSTNPIGRFGTGLKYAIAISLRLGWKIKITNYFNSVPEVHVFSLTKDTFRGQEIDVIYDNDKQLPFTSHYGAHWEPWTVLRELYCNTLDENGFMAFKPDVPENGSIIEVESDDFYELAQSHGEYFLFHDSHKSDIIHEYPSLEILKGKYAGRIYLKGIYVGTMKNCRYGYNFLKQINLTEDRTIRDEWSIGFDIATIISRGAVSEAIKTWMLSVGTQEDTFHFPGFQLWNQDFADAALSLKISNPSTLMPNIASALPKKKHAYTEAETQPIHEDMLKVALARIKKAGFNAQYPIVFIKTEDEHVIAFAEDKTVYLTLKAFKNMDYLVSTLIEEFAHCEGYYDETRQYETYLCDHIARLTSTL